MEVAEIFDLVDWYRRNEPQVGKQYQNLQNVLQHNATQNQKQPVREPLQDLVEGLKSLPMTELNLQQVAQLDKIGVGQYLGIRGAEFVERVVTEAGYDPATSASEMKTAADQVTNVTSMLESLASALRAAGFYADQTEEEINESSAMARIQFRQDASIGNIADMKKWSADWNDIARGIGHLVGETPHDMKVVGASKGSLIVCVTGSMALISAFAFMSKKVSGIVLDVLKVQTVIEDLRHKRISNEIIERSMRDDLKKREGALVDDIIAGLKDRAGGFAEEHDAHLKTAVKKYVDFSKKGGEVDYLKPPEPENDEEEADGPEQAEAHLIGELRDLISEIRLIKGETLLLEDQVAGDAQ
ncbi:hypothetical protein [Rhodalgimonas zhirmunskyi]|uniref:Uncharacterized protein n=1 Tax=Rhodalgimonas zhirmunskyi TaxID=2964767 RepID=A0AAJ1UCK2_9RHOB|nr:hypothetical protein [Rhodoalgimonas zhirmunskyi]MDQ2093677.1 hypothetical protein [Rhodoalgimonas zhirmunskyi]